MSYHLKFDEPARAGWRRIVHEQIAAASKLLRSGKDIDVAIHETRKAMKRVRALLKLMRPGLSPSDYKRENKRYGDIARELSVLRDKAVIAKTAEMLAAQSMGKSRLAALMIADGVGQETSAHGGVDVGERVASTVAALERAASAVDKLKLKSKSFAVVRRGLARSYDAGVTGMHKAYQRGEDEDFHEWRKAVQAHWRHMALISRAWPEHFAARVALAKDMSELLGTDHDLYVLIGTADSLNATGAEAAALDGLIRSAKARQHEIRDELKVKGATLFAEDVASFVGRMEAYWEAAKTAHASQGQRVARLTASSDDLSKPGKPARPRRSTKNAKPSQKNEKAVSDDKSSRQGGGLAAARKDAKGKAGANGKGTQRSSVNNMHKQSRGQSGTAKS